MTTTEERSAVNNQIINTMMQQLGGNKFMVMTGSKPQYKQINCVNPLIAFKLVRNYSKANYLKVTYMIGTDLYKMEFIRMTKKKIETLQEFNNIFGDQLQSIFTEVTQLYTKLF